MNSFRDEIYPLPGTDREVSIRWFSKADLKRAYTSILSSLEGGGVYEPVAQGIREEWIHRGFSKWDLIKIEKQFKGLKRPKKEK